MKIDIPILTRRIKSDYSRFLPAALLLLWSFDALISIFSTGFRTFDWAVIASVLLKLTVIGLNGLFFYRLLVLDDSAWYKRCKTYSGYFIVFVYVFYNLPRMSWEMSGLINNGIYLRLWISSLFSTLFPTLLFIILWLKPVQQKWDVYVSKKEIKAVRKEEKEQKIKRPLHAAIWENVDAVLQSIIIVIILQHFIFQLYVIPTESMVPTYLIKDRTLVTKLQSGPSIPLTKWRLPVLSSPERGEIVVFQSPEYTHKTLARRVFQQFIYYITLTLVDIDHDENGNPRKRYIVKRLIGEPGEQLYMLDDQVYVKKSGEDFHPLKADDHFSNVDLFKEPDSIRNRIAYMPLEASTREMLSYWDGVKNGRSLDAFSAELRQQWVLLEKSLNSFGKPETDYLKNSILSTMLPDGKDPETVIEEISLRMESLGLQPFQYADSYRYDLLLLYNAISNNREAIEAYCRGALDSAAMGGTDPFVTATKKFNLLFKIEQIKRLNLFCSFISEKRQPQDFARSTELEEAVKRGEELFRYLNEFYDNRNFPVTPAGNNNFIPDGNYFLMGDNRYNSLDFRHSHSGRSLKALDPDDKVSVMYYSLLHPYLLTEDKILGKAVLTFWPPDRIKFTKK